MTTPRKPVDPEIQKLREKHNELVREYKRRLTSASMLKTIIAKRLPKLVQADRQKLLDELMRNTTPALALPNISGKVNS